MKHILFLFILISISTNYSQDKDELFSMISEEKNQISSFKNALRCDPISAFGGIVAINSAISKKLALELNKVFF